MGKKGFTFLELVIIILIIGILLVIAVPKFIAFRKEAIKAAEQENIQSVKSGIRMFGINSALKNIKPMYPLTLDSANTAFASLSNPFFGTVLAKGISEPAWLKIDKTIYQGPSGSFYYYDPALGNILEYSGSKTIGSGVNTFLPALSANPYDNNLWASSNGGLYSPWSGTPLNFTLDFSQGGNYNLNIAAINQANHPDFSAKLGQPERTDWHLPTGYTKFNVQVRIDGTLVSPGNFGITASDTTVNSNALSVYVGQGQHTISMTWTNDSWTPNEHGDANMQLQDFTIQKQ